MLNHNKLLGKAGEELATHYLSELGYLIIVRNWRCKIGEIDIIAHKGKTIYFVEVKTRSSVNYGYPSEAINSVKLQRMYRTAGEYMSVSTVKGEMKLVVIEVINSACNLIEID